MIDSFQREINYVRLSVTDRCNLNCIYCNPNHSLKLTHNDILRFEEYIRLLKVLSEIGIKHVRITGGEPFVRKGLIDFIREVKSIDGISDVHITSNGTLLYDKINALKDAGLDSINLSLDSPDDTIMREISGHENCASEVNKCIKKLKEVNIPVKINTVLIRKIENTILDLLHYAEDGVPVRFIETMPIGAGMRIDSITPESAKKIILDKYPDLHPLNQNFGNGPAKYYISEKLKAPVGFITAVTNSFCEKCNRIRITSTGMLKPCLCYNDSADLKQMLRDGSTDLEITEEIQRVVNMKREHHAFHEHNKITETKLMSEIGG